MADDDQELTNAYRRRCISYPDYKPTMDFGIWINGLTEKIRCALRFTHDQINEVDAEIVLSISGRLQVGTALDAYNRLTAAEKEDYFTMVLKLTEEFTDPQEKQRFQEDFEYTKRKKGQSLKDYA